MSIKRTIITAATVVVAVAMVASVVGAQTPTVAQLMAEISALQAQLTSLSGSTTSTTTTGNTTNSGVPAACAGVTFTRNLVVGSTGSDVKCLQAILNLSSSTQVSATGAGSPGYETTTFGPKTLVAVKVWQAAAGFTPANQVGPMSRAKLNAWLGGTTSTTTTTTTTNTTTLPQGCTSTVGFSSTTGASCATGVVINQTGTISASMALDNPPAGAIIGGQAQADLLHINFTGTGTVTSITLQRSGISDASLFTAVYLYDGNTRITGGYSFNTNSSLTMNGLSVAVNGTHELSVRGDVAGTGICGLNLTISNCESSAAITLVGFTGNGSTVSANVIGNTMAVASGSLATSNLLTYTPGNPTVTAGSTNQTLWTRTIVISPRAVTLNGLTVKMIGSAPSNALANVGLYVDSTLVRTATINSNSQFVFDASSSPITLTTGQHLLEVRGDVVAGSSRSFYLSLEQGSDISVKDSQLGVYVTTTNVGVTATNVNGDNILINGSLGGSLTVNQDTAFNNTTTLVGGASDVTVASFTFTAYGEDEKITELDFNPVFGSLTPADQNGSHTLTNVGLYVNGGQIGSNVTATNATNDGSTAGTTIQFTNIGSNLIVPAGTSVTVAVKADVIGVGGVNPTGGTVQFNLLALSTNAQGQSSMQLTGTGAQSGQSLTVSSANVTFAGTTGFAATAAAPNNANVHIGSFTLQTGSAEGVIVNSIAVSFPIGGNANTMVQSNDLTNLTVKVNGSTVGSVIGQPVTSANNYSVTVPVAISSGATIDVYGNFGSLSGATACQGTTCNVTPSMLVSYRGVISGVSTSTNSSTPTAGVQTIASVSTLANGGITTVSSSSLAAQYVSGNASSNLPIVTFNVVANGALGGATIQNMTFTTVSNTIQSVTVNGMTANITSGTGTIYNVGILVPSTYSGVNIPVTVKLVGVGSGQSGVSGAPVQLTLSSITYNNGSTVLPLNSLTNAVSSTLNLVASVPTVALNGSTTSGLFAGTQQIGTFTITAGTGDIAVKQIPVTTTVNGNATITNGTVVLRDASGNTLSSAPAAINGGVNQDFIFPGTTGRTISSGTSETYTVWAQVGGSLGTAGQSSVVFQLGDRSGFTWYDVSGGSGALSGTPIYNYSTSSQSKSN